MSAKEEAIRLRAEGLIYRVISERLGVPRPTVYRWCTDPTGEKNRARKDRYRTACVDCGALTTGTGGGLAKAVKRCPDCAHIAQIKWTSERVVDAMHRFNELVGRPPAAADWNVGLARSMGHSERIERYQQGEWPSADAVQDRFGSWNAGLIAAGFPARGHGERCRRKDESGDAA